VREGIDIRYFVLYENDHSRKPLVLYRFDPSNGIEESWYKTKWNKSDRVFRYLTGQEWLDDEIDEAAAKLAFPNAFKALEESSTSQERKVIMALYEEPEQQPLDASIKSQVLVMISRGISAEEATSKYIRVPYNQSDAFDEFWDTTVAELEKNPIQDGDYLDIPHDWAD
jgi:hypothetical protein